MDSPAALLNAGGDFADGVIAHAGWSAAAMFVGFDRRAVAIEHGAGRPARDAWGGTRVEFARRCP